MVAELRTTSGIPSAASGIIAPAWNLFRFVTLLAPGSFYKGILLHDVARAASSHFGPLARTCKGDGGPVSRPHVCHRCRYGFVHRLDVPSSGLTPGCKMLRAGENGWTLDSELLYCSTFPAVRFAPLSQILWSLSHASLLLRFSMPFGAFRSSFFRPLVRSERSTHLSQIL